MQYVLTNAQMRDADAYTINSKNISSLSLMEKAGKALAEEAQKIAPHGKILCLCGGGNNGGDGFVCARYLYLAGREVETVFFAQKATDECQINRSEYEMLGGKLKPRIPQERYTLIIDCLFGTGFHGELTGAFADVAKQVLQMRANGTRVLSADIPSGINGDNGFAAKLAIHADTTLCFGELKAGVYMGDGPDFSGKVKRVDIGISLPELDHGYAFLSDKAQISALLPKRKRNSHKGCYGKTAIVAGSAKYRGAAYLSMLGALRSGVGYTTLFVPEGILQDYVLKCPEAIVERSNAGQSFAFEEDVFIRLCEFDSIAFGMGMGVSKDVAQAVKYLLENYRGKLILDADALNALSAYEQENLQEIFAKKQCEVVLTPHVKEFSRLSGKSVKEILSEGLTACQAFAESLGVCVLLKNASTVICDGVAKLTTLNVVGDAGQAKGGSGDLLSGVIAGLCGMGLSAFDGARAGAYLTGKAAELASLEYGDYSMLASDVASYMGGAFLSLRG